MSSLEREQLFSMYEEDKPWNWEPYLSCMANKLIGVACAIVYCIAYHGELASFPLIIFSVIFILIGTACFIFMVSYSIRFFCPEYHKYISRKGGLTEYQVGETTWYLTDSYWLEHQEENKSETSKIFALSDNSIDFNFVDVFYLCVNAFNGPYRVSIRKDVYAALKNLERLNQKPILALTEQDLEGLKAGNLNECRLSFVN